MALPTCPTCGSDDLARAGVEASGAITVRCESCGATFSREPRIVCPRCSSDDIEIGAYEGWAYDDIEEAREAPDGGSWAYLDREVFRCRKCNQRWRRSGPPRPYTAS